MTNERIITRCPRCHRVLDPTDRLLINCEATDHCAGCEDTELLERLYAMETPEREPKPKRNGFLDALALLFVVGLLVVLIWGLR